VLHILNSTNELKDESLQESPLFSCYIEYLKHMANIIFENIIKSMGHVMILQNYDENNLADNVSPSENEEARKIDIV